MPAPTVNNRFLQPIGNGHKENSLVLGGKVLQASGVQASAIANPTDVATTQAAVISILTVLRNCGIIAP